MVLLSVVDWQISKGNRAGDYVERVRRELAADYWVIRDSPATGIPVTPESERRASTAPTQTPRGMPNRVVAFGDNLSRFGRTAGIRAARLPDPWPCLHGTAPGRRSEGSWIRSYSDSEIVNIKSLIVNRGLKGYWVG